MLTSKGIATIKKIIIGI